MKNLRTYENYLTKDNQPKENYNEFLYDNGFGDKFYICSKCNSYKLTPIPSGGFSPPSWNCEECGEMNYSPKYMTPEGYWKWIEQMEIDKETKKFNI